jgi:hypothetical protein
MSLVITVVPRRMPRRSRGETLRNTPKEQRGTARASERLHHGRGLVPEKLDAGVIGRSVTAPVTAGRLPRP